MTDQTIPADKVREIAEAMRAAMRRDEHAYPEAKFLADLSNHIKDIEALLPPRPTLADMTEEERHTCRWMQAEGGDLGGRYVIATPFDDDGEAALVSDEGGIYWVPIECVIPRPDLPRLEWPGDKKPDTSATVPESTLAVGSVWNNTDALADACEESGRDQIVVLDRTGDAYVWAGEAEWWECSTPPRAAPFTIIHAGRKADQ